MWTTTNPDFSAMLILVSIPQSGFRPCGRTCSRDIRSSPRCFNPSVGIPSMWTGPALGLREGASQVSIPQSGFRPCGRYFFESHAIRMNLFQSLSRDSVHVDVQRADRRGPRRLVSIPQSGFRPCGLLPTIDRLMGSVSGFNPSVGIPSMWTVPPLAEGWLFRQFQSLSRDSVHVDALGWQNGYLTNVVSIPQSGFRPCGHISHPWPEPCIPSFNPSVGIPSMWTIRLALQA